jgi:beta-carotene 3-hydroxylase
VTLVWIGLLVSTLVAMEGVAYLLHRYVMHGPLWVLHESHHRPRSGRFERNDLFGVFFALPSMALIYAGTHGSPLLLAVGIGMTAYGMAYFAFHDVVVHRRVKNGYVPRSTYFKRIVRAHLVHHRTHTKEGATSFGFLYARERAVG